MTKLLYHKKLCQDQYKCRTRPNTPSVLLPPQADMSDYDRQWLSNTSLADWQLEDRWWLSKSCKSFLETREIPFGRKNVFLISNKNSPISNPELRQHSRRKSTNDKWKVGDVVDNVSSGDNCADSYSKIVHLSLAECKSKLLCEVDT